MHRFHVDHDPLRILPVGLQGKGHLDRHTSVSLDYQPANRPPLLVSAVVAGLIFPAEEPTLQIEGEAITPLAEVTPAYS